MKPKPKKPTPKESLAKNLTYLMGLGGHSGRFLEEKTGVSAKTINNMKNGRHDSTLENVEKVASFYGLTAWHLIMPDLPADLIGSTTISKMFANYLHATDEGRKLLEAMAEREARLNNGSNDS